MRGFEIQQQVDSVHVAGFRDKVEPAEELLGDGEGGLPNGAFADLRKHPLYYIRNLQRVGQVTLRLIRLQGL